MKHKQFKLSNVKQLISLAKKESAVMVGPLRTMQPLLDQVKAAPGCNCTGEIDYSKWRDKFELAMQLLNSDDMDKLKILLQAEEICYNYKNESGGISVQCF